jgi:pimeloyl-ACP methyl ester carboxylesterase
MPPPSPEPPGRATIRKKRPRGKWLWLRPLRFLGLLYLGLCLFAFGCSNRLIFLPPAPRYDAATEGLHMLATPRGRKVAALWRPERSPGFPVLLWSHGNAEDAGALAPLLARLQAEGFAVLAYDYPGYGLSEGSPSENGCYEAAEAAYQFLTHQQGVPPGDIILVGQSVGSGPACWLAERHAVRGLVLISPFRSAYRTVTRIPVIPWDKFVNIRRMAGIDEPLLVIHGEVDRTIAISDGRAVHDRHPGPKRFVTIPGAHHNNIWLLGFDTILTHMKTMPAPRSRG